MLERLNRTTSVAMLLLACACQGSLAGDGGGSDGGSTSEEGTPPGTTSNPGDETTGCNITTLLTEKCGSCHGADAPSAGLDLVSEGRDERLIDVDSRSCPDWPLVVAGSPERSNLYQKVASDAPPCGDRMPLAGPLAASEISCIADYIVALAPDTAEPCETCGGTTCVDVATDATHCGGCGQACGSDESCEAGSCVGCPVGTTGCGGSCVDLETSNEHCGACGNLCGGGQSCQSGSCACVSGSSTVSFSGDIAPLLDASCATNGCHAPTAGGRPGGGSRGPGDVTSDLTLSETTAYASLVDVPSGCGDSSFVTPGDVTASYLMNKLTGVGMCTGTRMPKGDAPLTPEQLDLIGSWICAGAPDN